MFSKQQLKLLKSLGKKKYRHQLGLFVVEGVKSINEFLHSNYELHSLFTTKDVFNTSHTYIISEKTLIQLSNLKNPNTALAIFKIPKTNFKKTLGITLVLDTIRDPGNLGTIIRLCDWFGVTQLICSTNSVDCYNSKAVQASMGSLTRVAVSYQNLEVVLKNTETPILGACLEGKNIYSTALPKDVFVVLGNEANGITDEVAGKITQKITIPQFGKETKTDSLNVANACAIILSEFLRQRQITEM